VLTAINWFAKRPYEYYVAPSFEFAEIWVNARMAGVRNRKTA
jgi:hypothetical protein